MNESKFFEKMNNNDNDCLFINCRDIFNDVQPFVIDEGNIIGYKLEVDSELQVVLETFSSKEKTLSLNKIYDTTEEEQSKIIEEVRRLNEEHIKKFKKQKIAIIKDLMKTYGITKKDLGIEV